MRGLLPCHCTSMYVGHPLKIGGTLASRFFAQIGGTRFEIVKPRFFSPDLALMGVQNMRSPIFFPPVRVKIEIGDCGRRCSWEWLYWNNHEVLAYLKSIYSRVQNTCQPRLRGLSGRAHTPTQRHLTFPSICTLIDWLANLGLIETVPTFLDDGVLPLA